MPPFPLRLGVLPGLFETEEFEPLVVLVVSAGHRSEIIPPAAGEPRRGRASFVAGPPARSTAATALTPRTLPRRFGRGLARPLRGAFRSFAILAPPTAPTAPPSRLAGPLLATRRLAATAIRGPLLAGRLPRLGRTHAVAGRHRRVVVAVVAVVAVARGAVRRIAAGCSRILRKPVPARSRTAPAAATPAAATAARAAFLVDGTLFTVGGAAAAWLVAVVVVQTFVVAAEVAIGIAIGIAIGANPLDVLPRAASIVVLAGPFAGPRSATAAGVVTEFIAKVVPEFAAGFIALGSGVGRFVAAIAEAGWSRLATLAGVVPETVARARPLRAPTVLAAAAAAAAPASASTTPAARALLAIAVTAGFVPSAAVVAAAVALRSRPFLAGGNRLPRRIPLVPRRLVGPPLVVSRRGAWRLCGRLNGLLNGLLLLLDRLQAELGVEAAPVRGGRRGALRLGGPRRLGPLAGGRRRGLGLRGFGRVGSAQRFGQRCPRILFFRRHDAFQFSVNRPLARGPSEDTKNRSPKGRRSRQSAGGTGFAAGHGFGIAIDRIMLPLSATSKSGR